MTKTERVMVAQDTMPGKTNHLDRPAAVANSLTSQAYGRLEEMIVTLRLEPGQILSEAFLVGELHIGRTPVREALQRLAFEGLVVILPRRGVLVSEIDLSQQLTLLEVRREIERLIARKAASRADEAERQAFSTLADGLARAAHDNDAAAFMQLDLRFNQMTLAAARNDYATRTMRLMQGLSRRFWYRHYRETFDLGRCAHLHRAVAETIAAGEPERAAAASDALLDYIAEFSRATV